MSGEIQKIEGEVVSLWEKIRRIISVIGALIAAISGTAAVSMLSCGKTPPATSSSAPTAPPAPMPEAPGPDSLKTPIDPINAVCQIQFGNAGCSATVVGPRLPDGRWQLLSANHCVEGQPTSGYAKFRTGLVVRIVVQAHNKGPDYSWLVTELPVEKLPYTLLADALPKAGDQVYHCGFGIDNPGNRENGTVVQPDNGSGQTQYRISVSSGDSGGGIAFNSNGHVLSPVCCTTAKGRVADVWGATVTACRAGRPLPSPVADTWTPIEIPIRMPE